MNADQARNAMLDYDAYYNAVNGKVNDMFYYYREQAALKVGSTSVRWTIWRRPSN